VNRRVSRIQECSERICWTHLPGASARSNKPEKQARGEATAESRKREKMSVGKRSAPATHRYRTEHDVWHPTIPDIRMGLYWRPNNAPVATPSQLASDLGCGARRNKRMSGPWATQDRSVQPSN